MKSAINNKIRASNIELLRVLAMCLIFLNHLSYHGGFFEYSTGVNRHVANLFVCGGKLGVAVFVLIGAYFLIEKSFKMVNVIGLWIKTFIISVIGAFFMFLTSCSIKDLIRGILPFYTAVLWFVPVYIVLLFLSPFLNKLIHNISKLQLFLLILVLLYPLGIIPMLRGGDDVFLGTGNLSWFVYLYFIASYIRLYIDEGIMKYKWIVLVIFICGYFTMFLLIELFGVDGLPFRSNGSLLILICSISMLLFFGKCIRTFQSRIINILGKASFVVYLMHDNPARELIWKNILKTPNYYTSSFFIVYAILLVVVFFTISIIVNEILQFLNKIVLNTKPVINFCNTIDSLMKID